LLWDENCYLNAAAAMDSFEGKTNRVVEVKEIRTLALHFYKPLSLLIRQHKQLGMVT
jgi:hypothetical protein